MVAKAMKQASEADEGALRQTKRSFQVSEIHEKRWKGHKWWRLHDG